MQEAMRAAGQGQGPGQDHVQTDEEWWAASDRPDRGNWLRAYYAERGGHLVIMGAYVQPCLNCLGAGQVSQLGPGRSEERRVGKEWRGRWEEAHWKETRCRET